MNRILLLLMLSVFVTAGAQTYEPEWEKTPYSGQKQSQGKDQDAGRIQHSGEDVLIRNIAGDASPAVLQKILYLEPGTALNLTFEKGTYHFWPDKAYEFYRHISNHDDVLTRSAFPIVDMDNVCIDGQGSTFIFHGRMIPFLIEDSKNVTIKNLSIDWATPFHSEGLVVARDEENNTYDLKFSDAYPYEIRNGTLVFLKEYFEHTMGQAYFFDPALGGVAHNTLNHSIWGSIKQPVPVKHGQQAEYLYPWSFDRHDPTYGMIGKEIITEFKEVAPGIIRVYNHAKALPPAGWVQVMKGEKLINRTAPAIHIVGVDGFTAENVDILHAGGMGVIAEFSSDLMLDHVNVIPPEGRLVSVTADATHFIGCRGMLTMKDSRFSNQLDDGTNIHGAYHPVTDILDGRTIGIRMGHFQQQSLRVGNPGDTIGLIRKEHSIFPYAKLTLQTVREINSRYAIISFQEDLPADMKAGEVIENLSAYPEVLIQNCEFSRNRAHGVLISTPRKTLIEGCLFSGDMCGILCPANISHWYESGNACNLEIRNNTFRNSPYGGSREACITIRAVGPDKTIFRNIRILDNKFDHFENLILDMSHTVECYISGNTITNSESYPQRYPEYPVFRFAVSTGVKFENNEYRGKAKVMIEKDELSQIANFK